MSERADVVVVGYGPAGAAAAVAAHDAGARVLVLESTAARPQAARAARAELAGQAAGVPR